MEKAQLTKEAQEALDSMKEAEDMGMGDGMYLLLTQGFRAMCFEMAALREQMKFQGPPYR